MIKIGINGYGRIGRLAFRVASARNDMEVVAINDILEVEALAYLLKFDSVHGKFKGEVSVDANFLVVNSKKIRVTSQKNPENINWGEVDVDYVLESTGLFTEKEKAYKHILGGAKKVVISAPSNDVPMFVMGVNHTHLTKNEILFSNASCTTNCLAPILKLLHTNFGIEEAFVNTVHAATPHQTTVDGPMKKWRRGRSALNNIIPTTTEAGKAVVQIMPELEGKILAMAVRVPTADVSLIDLTVKLNKATSYNAIKEMVKNASENDLKGIMGYTEDEVVSQDFVSETCTSVFDAAAGMELNSNFYKLILWYDNEFGYANKVIELIAYAASLK